MLLFVSGGERGTHFSRVVGMTSSQRFSTHSSHYRPLIQHSAVSRNRNDLPWDELAAGLQCDLCSSLQSAAARHFHANDRYTLNVVVPDALSLPLHHIPALPFPRR